MPRSNYHMKSGNSTESAEMTRLLLQDRLFTQAAGGVFAEGEIQPGMHVIDVGCGPGVWLLDFGAQHLEVKGVGIDNDLKMIQYAKSRAQAMNVSDRFSFEAMDIREIPWSLPSNYFDLVNARLLAFLPPVLWPDIVSEMVRICRPRGTIRLTETEMGVSNNSPALEQWYYWFFLSLYQTGQSFSSNGHRLTVTAALPNLLRKAGLQQVKVRAHGIDWSAGTEAHSVMYENMRSGAKIMQPFMVATGVANQEQLDANYPQMLSEMQNPDFAAVHYLLTAWGQKQSKK